MNMDKRVQHEYVQHFDGRGLYQRACELRIPFMRLPRRLVSDYNYNSSTVFELSIL